MEVDDMKTQGNLVTQLYSIALFVVVSTICNYTQAQTFLCCESYTFTPDSVIINYKLTERALKGEYEIRLRIESREGYFTTIGKSEATRGTGTIQYRKENNFSISWYRGEPGEYFMDLDTSDYKFTISAKLLREYKDVAKIEMTNEKSGNYFDNDVIKLRVIIKDGIDEPDKLSWYISNQKYRDGKNITINISDIIKNLKKDKGEFDVELKYNGKSMDSKKFNFEKRRIDELIITKHSIMQQDTLYKDSLYTISIQTNYGEPVYISYASEDSPNEWKEISKAVVPSDDIEFSEVKAGSYKFVIKKNSTIQSIRFKASVEKNSEDSIEKVFKIYDKVESSAWKTWRWIAGGVGVIGGAVIYLLADKEKDEGKPYALPPTRPGN